MAVRVRDLNKSATRFEQRAALAVQEYLDGVTGGANWETAAANSQASWQQGVTQAAQRGAYAAGVRRAGNAKFLDGVRIKGATRYPQGVANAGAAWLAGFEPFANAIAQQTLPNRGPKRSQANRQRMLANLDTIIREKERRAGTAAGGA